MFGSPWSLRERKGEDGSVVIAEVSIFPLGTGTPSVSDYVKVAVRELEAMDPGAVLKKVARYFELPEAQLTGKRTGHRDERGMALELMYRYGGASQARIGELVGLDYTAVSRERKRLRDRIESDKGLRKALREIEVAVLS